MTAPAALILVDLQAGAFGGCGIPPAHAADLLLRNAGVLLREARASGIPVVHVQHCAGRGEVFEEGAPGWPIVPQLRPGAGEVVVRKRASNAFEDTELDTVLREIGARHVVVTGIQSEHCVAATCRGALRLGYGVWLAEDGHSTWPDGTRAAVDIIAAQNEALAREGVALGSTERLVEWLRARRTAGHLIASVTLVVREYDEAISFFTDALSFRVVEDTPLGGGKRWVVVAPSGSRGASLLLARAATPEQAAHVGNQTGGRVSFFLHTREFWADYRHMQARGVKFAEEPREEPYGRVVVFFDLYGNKWDLVQRNDA